MSTLKFLILIFAIIIVAMNIIDKIKKANRLKEKMIEQNRDLIKYQSINTDYMKIFAEHIMVLKREKIAELQKDLEDLKDTIVKEETE